MAHIHVVGLVLRGGGIIYVGSIFMPTCQVDEPGPAELEEPSDLQHGAEVQDPQLMICGV